MTIVRLSRMSVQLASLMMLGALSSVRPALGQTGYTPGNSGLGMKVVPTATTSLAAGIVYLTAVHLTDPSGTATTVSLYDGSTLIYSWPMGGANPTTLDIQYVAAPVSFASGLSWSSSAANTAMGEILWQR